MNQASRLKCAIVAGWDNNEETYLEGFITDTGTDQQTIKDTLDRLRAEGLEAFDKKYSALMNSTNLPYDINMRSEITLQQFASQTRQLNVWWKMARGKHGANDSLRASFQATQAFLNCPIGCGNYQSRDRAGSKISIVSVQEEPEEEADTYTKPPDRVITKIKPEDHTSS
jgi:hypothetical protein